MTLAARLVSLGRRIRKSSELETRLEDNMLVCIIALTVALVSATTEPPAAMENVNSFDSVDTNEDGEIDFNEFEKWQKSSSKDNNDVTIRDLFTKYDTSRDHVLDVAEFVPLAYELSKKPIDAAEQIFKRMDLNSDGTVDTNEADIARKEHGAGIIDGVLAVADSNNDGQLSYEEFTAQLNYKKPKSTKEANKEMAYQVLTYMDTNQDGKLSAQEIYKFASVYNKLNQTDVAHLVSSLDADKDGYVTVRELERIPDKIAELANIQPPPAV